MGNDRMPIGLVVSGENPLQALDMLGKYVIGVHCKDGKRPERKGEKIGS